MPRVLGIDPGTLSIDLCGLDDGVPVLEQCIPTADAAREPDRVVDAIRAGGPWTLIAGPSGYGLPLVPIEAVGEREMRLAFLARPGEPGGIGGFRRLLGALRQGGFPVILTPGVIHLATVAPHRKLNRVDMGTADKVCAAALALHEEARRLATAPGEVSFTLVELGGAFSAVLTVHRGAIVDGAGGSSGPLGYRAAGALDGEVAYLLGTLDKGAVFTGGAAYAAGAPDATPEALAARTDPAARVALDALVEGVVRTVAAQRAATPGERPTLLSGRLCRVPALLARFRAALAPLGEVRLAGGAGDVKEAARGAALIADGLAGGRHVALVEALQLRRASGTAVDHLHLAGAAEATHGLRA